MDKSIGRQMRNISAIYLPAKYPNFKKLTLLIKNWLSPHPEFYIFIYNLHKSATVPMKLLLCTKTE